MSLCVRRETKILSKSTSTVASYLKDFDDYGTPCDGSHMMANYYVNLPTNIELIQSPLFMVIN